MDGVEEVRHLLMRDYLILAAVGSLGVIQLGAARSWLRGLWLVPRRKAVHLLGMVLLAAGPGWYYLSPLWVQGPWPGGDVPIPDSEWATADVAHLASARNISDVDGGLAGSDQAMLALVGSAIAMVIASVGGKVTTRRTAGGESTHVPSSGLAVLNNGSLLDALRLAWSGRDSPLAKSARALKVYVVRSVGKDVDRDNG